MADNYFTLVCDDEPKSVVVTDSGPHVLEVAKLLRRLLGLSLWRGKNLLGQLPATILENVSEDVAETVAREFREAGARAEVQPWKRPLPVTRIRPAP